MQSVAAAKCCTHEREKPRSAVPDDTTAQKNNTRTDPRVGHKNTKRMLIVTLLILWRTGAALRRGRPGTPLPETGMRGWNLWRQRAVGVLTASGRSSGSGPSDT